MFSGPMFERSCDLMQNIHKQQGSHYSTWSVRPGKEMETLKLIFPDGEADEMNFILFSTSGIHGSYLLIEDIENSLNKYGTKSYQEAGEPEDYCGNYLSGLIIQPRLVCLRYFGEMKVSLEDIPYLKKLRESSLKCISRIGFPET